MQALWSQLINKEKKIIFFIFNIYVKVNRFQFFWLKFKAKYYIVYTFVEIFFLFSGLFFSTILGDSSFSAAFENVLDADSAFENVSDTDSAFENVSDTDSAFENVSDAGSAFSSVFDLFNLAIRNLLTFDPTELTIGNLSAFNSFDLSSENVSASAFVSFDLATENLSAFNPFDLAARKVLAFDILLTFEAVNDFFPTFLAIVFDQLLKL